MIEIIPHPDLNEHHPKLNVVAGLTIYFRISLSAALLAAQQLNPGKMKKKRRPRCAFRHPATLLKVGMIKNHPLNPMIAMVRNEAIGQPRYFVLNVNGWSHHFDYTDEQPQQAEANMALSKLKWKPFMPEWAE